MSGFSDAKLIPYSEKWKPYEDAVNEMFLRTHAPKTPWTLIEGNCKRFARIKALDVVIEAIEKAIAEKYGKEAVVNPKSQWDDEKEKE